MSRDEERDLLDFATEAAELVADRHCEDVRLLDVRGLSQVCNFILSGSGTSDRSGTSICSAMPPSRAIPWMMVKPDSHTL